MFLVNSRYRHFSAAPFRSGSKFPHVPGRTFSLGYGAILPSSLTRVLSSALGFSPHLPVSVCGTITCRLARGFSRQHGIGQFASPKANPRNLSALTKVRICLDLPPTGLNRHFHPADDLPSCVPPSLKRRLGGTGILTCFPSPTPFGLGLGID